MSRGVKIAIALVLLVMCAGLGAWTWYLSGQSLEIADHGFARFRCSGDRAGERRGEYKS